MIYSIKKSLFFLLFASISVRAESLNEIADFSERICANTVEGHITKTDIEANIKGDINGLAKAIGLSVGADGKIKHGTEDYSGIPLDKLPAKIPTPAQCKSDLVKILLEERKRLNVSYKTCRLADFGIEKWGAEDTITQTSGWVDGGSNPDNWCNTLISQIIQGRSIGPQHKSEVLDKSEEARWTGLRHREYNYHCTVNIKWNPIYNAKTDPLCGVI